MFKGHVKFYDNIWYFSYAQQQCMHSVEVCGCHNEIKRKESTNVGWNKGSGSSIFLPYNPMGMWKPLVTGDISSER